MLVKIEPKIEQDIKPNIGVKCQNCGQEKLPEVDPENVAGGVKFQCENCIAISSVVCFSLCHSSRFYKLNLNLFRDAGLFSQRLILQFATLCMMLTLTNQKWTWTQM